MMETKLFFSYLAKRVHIRPVEFRYGRGGGGRGKHKIATFFCLKTVCVLYVGNIGVYFQLCFTLHPLKIVTCLVSQISQIHNGI